MAGLWIALALFAADAAAGPSPEARSIEAARLFPMWTDYQALDPDTRTHFTIVYRADTPRLEDGAPLPLWIEDGAGGFARLEADAAGALAPPDPERLEAGARVFTDAPPGAVTIAMTLAPSLPMRQEYEVAALELSLSQARRAMREALGVRALFAPRLQSVSFVFDGPAPDAEIVLPDGSTRTIETVFENVVRFDPELRAHRRAVAVRFGDTPVRARLDAR